MSDDIQHQRTETISPHLRALLPDPYTAALQRQAEAHRWAVDRIAEGYKVKMLDPTPADTAKVRSGLSPTGIPMQWLESTWRTSPLPSIPAPLKALSGDEIEPTETWPTPLDREIADIYGRRHNASTAWGTPGLRPRDFLYR